MLRCLHVQRMQIYMVWGSVNLLTHTSMQQGKQPHMWYLHPRHKLPVQGCSCVPVLGQTPQGGDRHRNGFEHHGPYFAVYTPFPGLQPPGAALTHSGLGLSCSHQGRDLTHYEAAAATQGSSSAKQHCQQSKTQQLPQGWGIASPFTPLGMSPAAQGVVSRV